MSWALMIWLVWAWSAVTMTSVSPCVFAKSMPTLTASSRSLVSPIWPHGLAAWSCLSIEAPSTWRKKPLSLWRRSIDFFVICASVGWVPGQVLADPSGATSLGWHVVGGFL